MPGAGSGRRNSPTPGVLYCYLALHLTRFPGRKILYQWKPAALIAVHSLASGSLPVALVLHGQGEESHVLSLVSRFKCLPDVIRLWQESEENTK